MDDEDGPQLSAAALAALEDLYGKDWRANVGKKDQEAPVDDAEEEDQFVSENWGMSQFWYDDATSDALANEALEIADGGPIACISSPSAFRSLRRMRRPGVPIHVLEYDKRFARYGDAFTFYDYNAPAAVPDRLKGAMKVLIVDPPYLSEECQTKVAETVRLLASSLDPSDPRRTRVIWNTGATMGATVCGAVPGLRRAAWQPRHARNLANDFRCYTNYESPRLGLAPADAT